MNMGTMMGNTFIKENKHLRRKLRRKVIGNLKSDGEEEHQNKGSS